LRQSAYFYFLDFCSFPAILQSILFKFDSWNFTETIQQHDPKVVDLPVSLEAASSEDAASKEVVVAASAEVSAPQPTIDAAVAIPEARDAGTKRTGDSVEEAPVSKTSKADE
jgi:hypothetical protein